MSYSRELRREAEQKREDYVKYYIDHFSSLLHNSFSIENEPDLPKRYLFNILINNKTIVY